MLDVLDLDDHVAVMEMLERTSTTYAPRTLVENEDKLWVRVKVLEILNRAIARLGEATGDANEHTGPAAAMSQSKGE